MENEAEELELEANGTPSPSKSTRVAQGTEIMLTGVAEGIGKEQMEVATNIVAAVKPYDWPPAVIAKQMLVMRMILFESGQADYDPQKGRRMFYDEGELEQFVSTIQKMARSTHGMTIETNLRRYCVARRGGNSVSSGPRPVADWEFQNASELLSFLSSDDRDVCIATLKALGTYSMPLDAITNTILKQLATDGPSFYEQAKAEIVKRIAKSARKTPLSFPVGRTQPAQAPETPPRSPSPVPPERPNVAKQEHQALPAFNALSNPVVAPIPEWFNPAGPQSASAVVTGWQNHPPDANSSRHLTPAFEAFMNQLQLTATAPQQQVAQGSASAPVHPVAAPPIIPPPAFVTAPNPVRVYNPSVLKVGNGPGTFKWWNVSVDAPVVTLDDLRLSHQPAKGDVLTWFNPTTSDSIGIFTFTDMGWANVTRSYCMNDGTIVFPGSNRLLSWKSDDTRTPTWVLEKTFRRDKKFIVGDTPEYALFIKHFALAGNRGVHVTPSPSASIGPNAGVAA
ncbi:hypothetical protein EST38_g7367 [Candolleomyces aberdarensis]|uniref:Uncharacterized protein n=1 Tax=Candolleomyces aberdarensis TaxID=2316362 RepID=A0A4Q2DFA9_9AGAR|nr:hypothetical protein EST38_g7367 [Candolleomyces aberdarensis]